MSSIITVDTRNGKAVTVVIRRNDIETTSRIVVPIGLVQSFTIDDNTDFTIHTS